MLCELVVRAPRRGAPLQRAQEHSLFGDRAEHGSAYNGRLAKALPGKLRIPHASAHQYQVAPSHLL